MAHTYWQGYFHGAMPGKSFPRIPVLPPNYEQTLTTVHLGRHRPHRLGLGLCLPCSPQSMVVHGTIRHTIHALKEGTCHTAFLALYLLIPTAPPDLLSSRTRFPTWGAEAATPLYLRQSPWKSGVGGNMDLINFRLSFI